MSELMGKNFIKNGNLIINKLGILIGYRSLLRGLPLWRDFSWRYWTIDKLKGRRIKPVLWFHLWVPVWHEGRGPYLSIGLWFIRIMRGY